MSSMVHIQENEFRGENAKDIGSKSGRCYGNRQHRAQRRRREGTLTKVVAGALVLQKDNRQCFVQ